MSRLTRDGTAEPISRDQILRHARGQGTIIFPVQLTSSRIGSLTRLIHTLLYVMTIHTYIQGQRVTHGDNPLLGPTGIQIATKSNAKQWDRPISKRFIKPPYSHIESYLDRLGLLWPTHNQRYQPVLINKSKFLKATHRTKMRKTEILS